MRVIKLTVVRIVIICFLVGGQFLVLDLGLSFMQINYALAFHDKITLWGANFVMYVFSRDCCDK
jgi:hypothetical protein